MKVPEFRKVNRGETGPLPEGVELAIEHLEKQIEAITNAIMRLDFWNNFLGDVKTVSVIHNTPTTFKLSKLTVAPEGAIILASPGRTVTGFAWSRVDQLHVQITVLFSGSPTTASNVTLAIFGQGGD